ncbi:MAG: TolC family protein [Devosia sp.]
MAVAAAVLAMLSGCATNPGRVSISHHEGCVSAPDSAVADESAAGSSIATASGAFAKMIRDLAGGAPSVNAALTRWQVDEQKIEVARAALRPGAEVFGEGGIRGTYGVSASKTNPYSYGIRVSVPVFDGSRGLNTANSQAMVSIAAKQAAVDELASTILDLVGASASIAHANAVIGIRDDQTGSVRALLDAVKSDQTSGTASKVDVAQVEGQLSGLDIERRQAEADRAQAVQSFAGIAGSAPGAIAPIGSIAKSLPQNTVEAEALASSDNPRIARILALQSAAGLQKQVADAGYMPNVSLDFEVSRNGDFVLPGAEETDFSALIRFALPLPVGGSIEAQQRQKALELRAANLEVDATRKGVFAGVDAAVSRLGLARQGLKLARTGVAQAKAALEGIRAERELGERSVFDELSALNAYAEARIKAADMDYEVIVTEHLLAAQTGRIDDIYGIDLRN